MSERIWWGWKYAIVALAVLAFLMLVALPLATTVLLKNSDSPSRNLEVLQRIEDFYAVGMLLFMAAWTFFLGGTLASFLNVVAWRVPRGKSILGSSHCPSCNTQLTFRDNVPFLGWLKNWGHCSTCDAPFSSRYFFAELILGSIFLSVAGIYLISGGYLLPFREPDRWKILADRGRSAKDTLHFGFGYGPRVCPGKFLGQLEVGLVVGAVIKMFRLRASAAFPAARAGVSTKPADGVLVELELRS